MTGREKTLFTSLWILLALGFGIWKFWPRETEITLMDDPKVTLSQELLPLIERAELKKIVPSEYLVSVTLKMDFYKKINGANSPIRIGYEFNREKSFGGGISVLGPFSSPTSLLALSNPDRVSAKEIRLFLAH
jgi:hypothetical protein